MQTAKDAAESVNSIVEFSTPQILVFPSMCFPCGILRTVIRRATLETEARERTNCIFRMARVRVEPAHACTAGV